METNSWKLIRLLEKDGWVFIGATGDHHHFKHPEKPGKVTVPHPNKDISIRQWVGLSTGRMAKALMRYVAFIHKDPDSAYGVSFPDFPGCISAGDTLEEAAENAVEALSGHVRWMEADGDPIPEPRSMDEIIADPSLAEAREGALLAVVPLVRDLGSTTRINVSLDLGLLQALDAEAKHRKQTRSAFIASAVRKELTS